MNAPMLGPRLAMGGGLASKAFAERQSPHSRIDTILRIDLSTAGLRRIEPHPQGLVDDESLQRTAISRPYLKCWTERVSRRLALSEISTIGEIPGRAMLAPLRDEMAWRTALRSSSRHCL